MVHPELLEDLHNMVPMFGKVPEVYQDVIKEHNDKAKEELPEHLIHEPMEYRGLVGQTVQHNLVFIVDRWCYKGGLSFITLTYPYEVVGTTQVQLDKDASASKRLQGCRNQRKGIAVLNGL